MKEKTFEEWLEQLIVVTADHTGKKESEIKIDEAEARKWFDDGFDPYQTFRETYQNENDSF